MRLRKKIKQDSKWCLRCNWGKAIAIGLLSLAMYMLFTMIEMIISMLLGLPFYIDTGVAGRLWDNIPNTSAVSIGLSLIMSIGFFVILTPLKLGTCQWYYSLSDGKSEEMLSIFNWFSSRKKFFQSLLVQINLMVRKLLWAVAYLWLPVGMLVLSFWYAIEGPGPDAYLIGTAGIVFSVMLFILFFIFFMITIQRYFLVRYYLLTGRMGVLAAVRQSCRATRKRRMQILLFRLSYIGWAASCFFVLPLLYVMPYYEMSAALYARFLIEGHSRKTTLVPVTQSSQQNLGATQVFAPQGMQQKPQQGQETSKNP